jgi:hypothetical protein
VLQEAIGCHHWPESVTEHLRETQDLCLANLFAQPGFELDHFMSEDNQEMRKLAETSAMDYNLLPELIDTEQQQCSKIQSIICGLTY